MHLLTFCLSLIISQFLIGVEAQFKFPSINIHHRFPEDLHFYLGENAITRHFCIKSVTVVKGIQSCKGGNVFRDTFEKGLDKSKWLIEQYIASYSDEEQNYEFVTYLNNPSNLFVSNQILYVRPIPINNLNILRATWKLSKDCTSRLPSACSHTAQAGFILPPVTSGKIRSKLTFKYGKVIVKAKLPGGDWIFPIINLVSVNNPKTKIVIAFARGNDHLTLPNGKDVGSRILYGGPILDPSEPERSRHLNIFNVSEPFNLKSRTYSCVWLPDQITFYVDDKEYGTTYSNLYPELNNSEFYISLGVGVGGINDFPDDSQSNGSIKPWKNKSRKNIRDFFNSLNVWSSTWKSGSEIMQIESVEVTAI